MKRQVRTLIAIAGLAVAAISLGQGGPPPGGGPGGPPEPLGGPKIVMIPEVQTELRLTATQKDSVRQVMESNRPPRPEPGSPPPSPEEQHRFVERIHNALRGVMQDTQFHRLMQLELQAEGAMAIGHPEVAQHLGLSDDQKGQIRSILEENRPPRPEPGTPPPPPDEMDRQRQRVERLILAVLSDAQKTTWNQMKGAPFQFPRPPRR